MTSTFVRLQNRSLISILAISLIFPLNSALAADNSSNLKIQYAQKRHATKSLRDIAKSVPRINPSQKGKMLASGHHVAGDGKDYLVPNKGFPLLKLKSRSYQEKTKKVLDSVRQKQLPQKRIPTADVNFDGIPNVTGAVPPDTNGDVGPNHYVQTVNTAIAVWDKSGNQIMQPTPLNSLWTGLGGLCETTNRGDPIVLYDAVADRWLISQFAFNGSQTDNRQCIAISQTPDPTGAYYAYDFEFSSTNFNDYPKFGIWQNGYFMSVNQFAGGNYAGVAVVAYERDAMLTGSAARQVKLDLGTSHPNLFSLLPADLDGALLPPAGEPNYFFGIQDDWFHGSDTDKVQIFEFAIDWNTPESATFTLAQELQVAAMDLNIETSEIVQPNGVALDSLRGFAQYRLAYRNFGNKASMVVNHNVDANGAGQSGLRWYQIDIDNTSGAITLADQGTFAPDDGIDRWMGSVAMDAIGNMAIGYNAVSDSLHPSIYYAGRLSEDPAGELSQGEGVLVQGTGSQRQVQGNRWADYSSLSVDPADDCTFWYTNEYYKAEDNGTLAWSTRIGSFKFPNCTALPTGIISGQVTDADSGAALPNIRVSAGGIATSTDADGNYSLRLAEDTYDISYSGYWYQGAANNNVVVTENETTNADIALSLAPTTTVNGTVSDDAGKGWPLYSQLEIRIPDASDIVLYTDPFTGEYSVELVAGIAVGVSIRPQIEGYLEEESSISPVDSNGSYLQNFGLDIDLNSCTAPGYTANGLFQGFENGIDLGWTSVSNNEKDFSWITTASGRQNVTGGAGEAALIDSDAAGENVIDTSLISPEVVVANLESTTLTYLANFQTFSGNDNFDLDIRVDDDERWENVLTWTGNHGQFSGPGESVSVDLASHLNGVTKFQLRWHYYNANNEWFAQVDDVSLSRSCTPASGGSLAAGYVTDDNTGESIAGVNVTGVNSVISFTNQDPALTAAIYFAFVNEEQNQLLSSKEGYAQSIQEVTISNGALVRQDIQMLAPQLSLDQNPINVTVAQGVVRPHTVNIANSGKADGTFRVFEVNNENRTTLPMQGRFETGLRYSGPKDHLKTNAKHIRDYRPPYIKQMALGDVTQEVDLGRLTFAYGIGFDKSRNDIWVGSLSTQDYGGDDHIHRFLNNGTYTEEKIDLTAILNTANGWFGDLAYNTRTQTLWVTEVDNQNCIHEIDPVARVLTGNSICPQGIDDVQQGIAYDPISDTYFSGSWNDGGVIHRFRPNGELVSSISTGLAIAGLAYHPVSNKLYVSISAAAPNNDITVLNADDYSVIGGFNVMQSGTDVMRDNAQGGLDMDCDGNLWMVEQAQKKAYKIDVEESDACNWADIPWVDGNTTGEVAAESSSDFTVDFDTTALAFGDYQGQLVVENNSPYGAINLPVNLTVVEGVPGVVQFEVTAREVNEEQEVSFNVVRTDGKDFEVSIDFTTVNGTAVAGTDYTEASGTLTWSDFDDEPKAIVVPIGTIHNHKNFAIQLSNPQGGVEIGGNTRIEVSVIDKPKGSGSLYWWALFVLCAGAIYQRRSRNN